MNSASEIADRLRGGDRKFLARAITLLESSQQAHRTVATELLRLVHKDSGSAIRIGISGAPGVGKSTFIETFGQIIIQKGHQVAVLTVDPSSSQSGGSILGDKIRMSNLARNQDAFIRPSPAGDTLGGVTRTTQESIIVCEAAGFDVLIVETVGVGQSETAVANMTDLFMLLLNPTVGDEIQGIKRGITELADIVLVNKADGELQSAANQAVAEHKNAVGLLQARTKGWKVRVDACSALTGLGVEDVWDKCDKYMALIKKNGVYEQRRVEQAKSWLWTEISDQLLDAFKNSDAINRLLPKLEAQVARGKLVPIIAAQQLLDELFGEREAIVEDPAIDRFLQR